MRSSDPWNFLTVVRKGVTARLTWDVCDSAAAAAARFIRSPGSVSSYSFSPPTATQGGPELCPDLAAHMALHRGQRPLALACSERQERALVGAQIPASFLAALTFSSQL